MSGLHFKKRICLLLTAAALLFGPGCLQAQAKGNFYGAFEFSAQPMPENFCAITFDDGPSTFTPHLLDMLDEAGIHATFLMLGKNAAFYPDIVKRALAEGHEVGNHSYSHPNLRRLSYDAIEDQISKTNDILRSLGADPKVMRPPYGNSNANVEKAAEKLGLKVITWNMDSLDWKRLPEDYTKIPNEFGRPWEPGHAHGVYLFHDIHKRTVDDFPRMFAELKAAGCQRFVTVSDYLDNLFDDQEPVMLMERRHVQPAAAAAASAEVSQTESAAAQAQTTPETPAEGAQTASASQTDGTPQASPAKAPDSSEAPQDASSTEATAAASLPDAGFTGKLERQLRPWAGFAKDPINIMASQDTHLAVQELAGQTAPAETHAPEAGQTAPAETHAPEAGQTAQPGTSGDQSSAGSQL